MWDLIVSVPDHCLSFYLSVSLSADIAYMCIPSQITCNCYSKVFNAFNVFKVSSL